MIDKEVFKLWKEIYPEQAFGSGLKQYAGSIWIPSHHNVKNALSRIKKLEKTKDIVAKKFLAAIKRSLMCTEPQDPPGNIMNIFYIHLVVEGIKEKHILSLAEQSLNLLCVQEDVCHKKWPVEQQIFSVQQCDGARMLLETIKKQCKKKETKQALTAVQKRLDLWKGKISSIKLKKHDFKEIYPILKRRSKGLGRKKIYRTLLKDFYDYTETPEKIENLALSWIKEELPKLKKIMQKLAKRYKCKQTVEEIEKVLDKHQHIPLSKLVNTVNRLRKVLHPLAHKEWVRIIPKYNVKVVATPKYLVLFLPTAAMQPFNALTKPFCLSFVTTDKKASPSTALPDVVQTIIHEEYGHCVNFLNSYSSFVKKPRKLEILETPLHTPITEGLSFYRELESLKTFERMLKKRNKIEEAVVKEVEKYVPFEEFVDGITFVVMQWRMVRFLRALSDVRLNLDKQTFPQFIEWAHKKTGLSKKLIFDQTIHFQEMPGYAPCYSVFGQRLRKFQAKAIKKGYSQKEFNTYVASIGFPARSVFEKQLKKKFKLSRN